jgi:quercetin dioxygenase-like cupin family protein
MIRKFVLGLALVLLLGGVAIQAQAPAPSAIKRKVLMQSDIAPMPASTVYVVEGELAPSSESGWHTHPGHDFSYVRSGEATLDYQGKPSQTFKAGTALHNDPGVAHNVRNVSKTEPFKYSSVFIIEQGKPVAIPAPAPAKK